MIFEIKVQDRETQTHKQQTLVLDGLRVRLDTYTNNRDKRWYYDLFDDADEVLIQGQRLTVGMLLLAPFQYREGVPPGELFVQSKAQPQVDPGLASFLDGTHALIYRDLNG